MNETMIFGRPIRGDGTPCWRRSYSARCRRTVRMVHPTFPAIIALLGSYKSKIWIFACLFLLSGLTIATKTAVNYCYVKAKNSSLATTPRHQRGEGGQRVGVLACV